MENIKIQGVDYYKILQKDVKVELKKILKASSEVDFITFHWTAGRYNTPYIHYQINIGNGYILVAKDLLKWFNHQHTWKRNSNNIGISYMAMATDKNGKYLIPTKNQIEVCAETTAILQNFYNLNWDNIVDHAHFANIDGYPGERWDIRLDMKDAETQKLGKSENLYERTIRKAKYYSSKL